MQKQAFRLGILGFILSVAMTAPAQAQSVAVGAGALDGSFGAVVEGATALTRTAANRPLEAFGELGIYSESSVRLLSLGGGARVNGTIDEKLSWFGQGQLGILRASVGGDFGDLCDVFGTDCSATDLYFAPGVGINYALDSKKSLRGQFDLFISDGTAARFWVGVNFKLGQ